MKRKKIYISIPISGRSLQEAREHADRIQMRLSRMGFETVNPFQIYAGKNPTWEDYMGADLRALLDCDGICMGYGWEHSCGASIERAVAIELRRSRKPDFIISHERTLYSK